MIFQLRILCPAECKNIIQTILDIDKLKIYFFYVLS
jgi:hypothetical protein